MANIKQTFKEPVSPQSEKFEKDFNKTMVTNNLNVRETQENLNQVDGMLGEAEQSLKKKIFSLAKMESLVFSDPKLSAVYEEMAENGEEKYGYHYNETIQNMIFNDYVLNSPQYLQKYKNAIPKEKKRRDKSGINQLKKQGQKKMTQSGLAKLEKTDVDESTSAGSAGGAQGYTGYAGPSAWSEKGDLIGNSKKKDAKMKKPIGNITAISESNYLTDSTGFEKYNNSLNEEFKSKAQQKYFYSQANDKSLPADERANFKKMAKEFSDDTDFDELPEKIGENNIKEDTQTMIQNNGTSMSNQVQATGDMSNEVPMGTQATGGLNEIEEFIPHGSYRISNSGGYEIMLDDAGDAARVRDGFGSDNPETSDWLEIEYISTEEGESEPVIDPNGYNIPLSHVMKLQEQKELNEDAKLLEEINKELEAFSIHHDKLKLMSEERKTNSQILNQRVGDENSKNFKKDFQSSDTKKIIDVEKELEYKDQQIDVPKDPQKLGQDIEKQAIKNADMKGDEALKNVGDCTNDNGDEVPKSNLTTDEQEEVNLYRNGQHSLVYDNEPDKRFDDRMKADMGEDIYKMREKQLEFKGKAPMYNKDTQPMEDGTDKVQFDKDKSGWNERMGLKESMITGRYIDILGKRRLMEFRLNEVKKVEKLDENITMELGFDGLGNTYMSKTVNKKVIVNESVVNVMSTHKFYTDGENVVVIKNPTQSLNEGEIKEEKPVVNEQM
ncbi:MAG: hypothetical protein DRN27_08025, partial [Thermoplasmata archaeon]